VDSVPGKITAIEILEARQSTILE